MAGAALTYQQLQSGSVPWSTFLQDEGFGSSSSQAALFNAGATGGEDNASNPYQTNMGTGLMDGKTSLATAFGGVNGQISAAIDDPNNGAYQQNITDVNGKAQLSAPQLNTNKGNGWDTFFDALAPVGIAVGAGALAAGGAAGGAAAGAGAAASDGGVTAATATTATQADLAAGTYGASSLGDFAQADTSGLLGQLQSLYNQVSSNSLYQDYQYASNGMKAYNAASSLLGGNGQQGGANANGSSLQGGSMAGDLGSLISGGLGLIGGVSSIANSGKNTQQAMATADPYGQYRSTAASQLNTLENDPASILSSPLYTGMQAAGNANLNAQLAAQGLSGSGNQMAALQTLGTQTADSFYQQQLGNLEQLSGESKQNMGQAANIQQGQGAALQSAGQGLGSSLTSLLQGAGGLGNLWNSLSGGNSGLYGGSGTNGIGTSYEPSSSDANSLYGQSNGYDNYTGLPIGGSSMTDALSDAGSQASSAAGDIFGELS